MGKTRQREVKEFAQDHKRQSWLGFEAKQFGSCAICCDPTRNAPANAWIPPPISQLTTSQVRSSRVCTPPLQSLLALHHHALRHLHDPMGAHTHARAGPVFSWPIWDSAFPKTRPTCTPPLRASPLLQHTLTLPQISLASFCLFFPFFLNSNHTLTLQFGSLFTCLCTN